MLYLYSVLHTLVPALILCVSLYLSVGMGATDFFNSASVAFAASFDAFLGMFMFYVVFHNNNHSKRSLYLGKGDQNTSLFHWLKKVLTSADFWLCSLLLVVPVSLIGRVQTALSMPFYTIVAIMLPILILCETLQCRRWAEDYAAYMELHVNDSTEEYLSRRKPSIRKKLLNMVLCLLAYGFVGFLPYISVAVLVPILGVFASEIYSALIYIPLIILAIWLLRAYGTLRKRRKAIKELKELCTYNGYSLKDNTRFYKGLFYSTAEGDVVIEKGEKRYIISFIPVPYRFSKLVFYVANSYGFRPRILGMNVNMPVHKIGFGKEEGESFLVLSKAAANAKLWTGKGFSVIDNGEVLYGAKVYSATAFIAYFDRRLRKDNP